MNQQIESSFPDVFGRYVDLQRTFHELSQAGGEDEEVVRSFQIGQRMTWQALLENPRVVILSEAGSGKTREIRQAAQILRGQGKAAFFLRLENVANWFEDAFEAETGTFDQFEDWLASNDEGWLLLDSVDEARLRDPGDFERAIRTLGRKTNTAKDRVHIIITGRTSAWRARSDLDICLKAFPPPQTRTQEKAPPPNDVADEIEETFNTGNAKKAEKPSFLVVSLDDLNKEQIGEFARAKGIDDTQAFLAAIERADAFTFSARPEDLSELVQFWIDKGKIGGRLQLMQNSLDRRLEERDQARRDYRPLSLDRAREGAMLIAVAATLSRTQTLRIPDGSAHTEGLDVRQVLGDWDDRDQATLLARPIFDEAIYGTVRFHHRSVREYLTAAWFARLLQAQTSRRRIEGLFFREQYGMDIIVPALRPILPWLVLLDEKILDRVRRVAPEIFFEGGDPARLPVDVRRYVLAEVCEQIVSGSSGRSMQDISAVQRFANPDMAADIEALLQKYSDSDEIIAFLMRMIWVGELVALRPIALKFALNPDGEHYVRVTAIRALAAIGDAADLARLRESFLSETSELDRDWFGEILEGTKPTAETVGWTLACIKKLAEQQRFSVDQAAINLDPFFAGAQIDLLPDAIARLNLLLETPPVIERRYCEISEHNRWLLPIAGKMLSRLIVDRHPSALAASSLSILRKVSAAKGYGIDHIEEVQRQLYETTASWAELRYALFWSEVSATRLALDRKKGERLTEHWQASMWGSFSTFGPADFPYMLEEIVNRRDEDDRLVALSLAFTLYRNADRPTGWRDKLKRRTAKEPALAERLHQYLHPGPRSAESRRFEKTQARWKREDAARKRKDVAYHDGWRNYFDEKLPEARAAQEAAPGEISNPLYYLFQQARHKQAIAKRWTDYNWHRLAERYGDAPARFYRDGVVGFWRNYRPKLRSEGYPANTTAHGTILGLAGLEIEAIECGNSFPSALSEDEVIRACHYASFELNGFPLWFPALYAGFPVVVSRFMLHEITYELAALSKEGDPSYILSDISWSGQWAWDGLGPGILELLRQQEPANAAMLKKLLKILHGSNVPDALVTNLAIEKCRTVEAPDNLAQWLAVWCGTQPSAAIAALEEKTSAIKDREARVDMVMKFITALWGGRRDESINARDAYRTPEHLKALYLMVHQHVRTEEDIERAGTGVYSPGLRDRAQDSRNSLLGALTAIPGKEAFLALVEISKLHPVAKMRPWMLHHARTKAEQDGDMQAWAPGQVRVFAKDIERTPDNHRDLAELVHLRFLDLKDDLENGDSSVASLLQVIGQETEVRKYLGHELREKAAGRYSAPQEEELADMKRPDLRFAGVGFDGPVPVELKLADKWSGPDLLERLENQLCGDYLRDNRSNRGLFVLVYSGEKKGWDVPNRENRVDFDGLVQALIDHWQSISASFVNVEDIRIVGIDLTKRSS
ncbi:hypothetical protein GR253_31675 [Rhizobium leguminosarum]|nr:hypothetical protein [Rhizobium leguminosarum]